MAKNQPRKVRIGKLVHEEEYAGGQHDFTPWVEVNSSRLQRARFDHQTGNIQIDWGNGNPGYVYREAGYETWRAFIRSASKGQFVNRRLNSLSYAPLDTDELDIPSNGDRTIPMSGARNLL
jgi:KTSC domain